MAAVSKEYSKIVGNGLQDPDVVVPEYMAKLDTAGKQKVMDEIEKQFNEWKASQN